MLEKSVLLNIDASSKDMIKAIMLFICGGVTWATTFARFGSIGALIFAAFIVSGFVFMFIGLWRIYYKSMVDEEGYLYMSLPISNLNIVLGKVIAGAVWITIMSLLGFGFLTIFVGVPFETITNDLMAKEMGSLQVAISMATIPIRYFVLGGIICAFVMAMQMLINILNPRRFKPFISITVTALAVGAFLIVRNLIERGFVIVSDWSGQYFLFSLVEILVLVALTGLLVLFSKKILDSRYNLN